MGKTIRQKGGIDPDKLNKWWWLIVVIIGGVAYWGYIPQRLNAAESDIKDLKGWAQEIQGYTKAIQEQNQQNQQHQQVKYNVPAFPDYSQVPQKLPILEYKDDNGYYWCCNPNYYQCDRSWEYWYQC